MGAITILPKRASIDGECRDAVPHGIPCPCLSFPTHGPLFVVVVTAGGDSFSPPVKLHPDSCPFRDSQTLGF